MAKAKDDTFKLHISTLDAAMRKLKTDKERGQLLTAIYQYQKGHDLYTNETIGLVFSFFQEDFENDRARTEVANRLKSAAKKRYWNAKKQEQEQEMAAAPTEGGDSDNGENLQGVQANKVMEDRHHKVSDADKDNRREAESPDKPSEEGNEEDNTTSPDRVTFKEAKVGDIVEINGKRVIKRSNGAFVIPSLDEVAEYIQEKGYHFEPIAFLEYYENSKPHPWCMANKKPVKSWKQCCATFENHVFLSEGKKAIKRGNSSKSHAHDDITNKQYEPF